MFAGESKGGPARRGRGQRGAPRLAVGLQRSTACWLGLAGLLGGLAWASLGSARLRWLRWLQWLVGLGTLTAWLIVIISRTLQIWFSCRIFPNKFLARLLGFQGALISP